MIAVVDYGAGNLTSVLKAFRAVGAEVRLVRDAADARNADSIVVPGVGHFEATRALDERWRAAVRDAIARGVPVLGICLGMHWLYSSSEEAPALEGLGVFEGRILRITGSVKVPHVGWNVLSPGGDAMYFTHGFAAPVGPETRATTEHGVTFTAVAQRGNVTGMQFHPEKSGAAGLRLLSNWVESRTLKGRATDAL